MYWNNIYVSIILDVYIILSHVQYRNKTLNLLAKKLEAISIED